MPRKQQHTVMAPPPDGPVEDDHIAPPAPLVIAGPSAQELAAPGWSRTRNRRQKHGPTSAPLL